MASCPRAGIVEAITAVRSGGPTGLSLKWSGAQDCPATWIRQLSLSPWCMKAATEQG
jgi:hypothetical protein